MNNVVLSELFLNNKYLYIYIYEELCKNISNIQYNMI